VTRKEPSIEKGPCRETRQALEQRLEARLPASWKDWWPDPDQPWARGVAAVLEPSEWTWVRDNYLQVAVSDNGVPLALRVQRRRLLDPLYKVPEEGRPRKFADSLRDLTMPEERITAEHAAWLDVANWAYYLVGDLRVCPACNAEVLVGCTCICTRNATRDDPRVVRPTASLDAAKKRWPRLMPAFDQSRRLVEQGWNALGSSTEVRVLHACFSWPGTIEARLERLLDRWCDLYGYERAELPVEELRAFLTDHA
jgi:hypothetical protein